MRSTIDSERALWVYLLGLVKERVVNDSLADVTFHVSTGLLFLLRVNQALDNFECCRVVHTVSLVIVVFAATARIFGTSGR